MYLHEILEHKRREIQSLTPPPMNRIRPVLDPVAALKIKPFIAEIKKASPSLGVIRTESDIAGRARAYERGGAGAISVLTDKRYFHGDYAHLREACAAVALPLLCKDFILSEAQIDAAYCAGADFILLIADILNVRELRILSKRAGRYGMKVLYEIRTADQLSLLRGLEPELIGVNARNLRTFTVDREAALRTIASLPRDFLIVAESGINSPRDIVEYRNAGAHAFLIGTALMTADDPAALLGEFRRSLAAPCS